MRSWRVALPGLVALACLLASIAVILLSRPDRTYALSVILGVAAIGAGILISGERENSLGVSAAFIVATLAELAAEYTADGRRSPAGRTPGTGKRCD